MKGLRMILVIFAVGVIMVFGLAGCGGGGGGGGATGTGVTNAPSSPTGLATVPGNNQVSLSWTASSGASSYNVYRGASGALSAKTEIKSGVTGTSYIDATASNGTTYYYQVTAVDSAGQSAGSNEASATPSAPTPSSGTAIVPSSTTYGTSSVMQVVKLFDSTGKPLATPTINTLIYNGGGDFDGIALTPNGADGAIIDENVLHLFSVDYTNGTASHWTPKGQSDSYDIIDPGHGDDGDSIAFMENGDDAVVALDNSAGLLLFSGVVSGNPHSAAIISGTQGNSYDGVLLSADGKVLLARGSNGVTVFTVASQTPATGPLGGTVNYSFTKAGTVSVSDLYTATPANPEADESGGRDGMAISPTDDSRGVAVTNGASSSNIYLLTGLATTPAISQTLSVSGGAISVAIVPGQNSPSDLAIVGTNNGLLMYSGVSTGKLTLVGQLTKYNGTPMGRITSMAVTNDGKYAVVCDHTNDNLMVVPVSASGFGTPAGILNSIDVPTTDNMLIH